MSAIKWLIATFRTWRRRRAIQVLIPSGVMELVRDLDEDERWTARNIQHMRPDQVESNGKDIGAQRLKIAHHLITIAKEAI